MLKPIQILTLCSGRPLEWFTVGEIASYDMSEMAPCGSRNWQKTGDLGEEGQRIRQCSRHLDEECLSPFDLQAFRDYGSLLVSRQG